jgi:hypothetical protein
MLFSARRIKTPERGLLAMHPFVDVLEGRSLFTASAVDGVLAVDAVVDVPNRDSAASPWSTEPIDAAPATDGPLDDTDVLIARTTPGAVVLKPNTTGSAFSSERTIGDTDETLFGNVVWDRRGRYEPQPLPTEEQIAAARADSTGRTFFAADDGGIDASPFASDRPLTGAMSPYLTMRAHQVEHLFAA